MLNFTCILDSLSMCHIPMSPLFLSVRSLSNYSFEPLERFSFDALPSCCVWIMDFRKHRLVLALFRPTSSYNLVLVNPNTTQIITADSTLDMMFDFLFHFRFQRIEVLLPLSIYTY